MLSYSLEIACKSLEVEIIHIIQPPGQFLEGSKRFFIEFFYPCNTNKCESPTLWMCTRSKACLRAMLHRMHLVASTYWLQGLAKLKFWLETKGILCCFLLLLFLMVSFFLFFFFFKKNTSKDLENYRLCSCPYHTNQHKLKEWSELVNGQIIANYT